MASIKISVKVTDPTICTRNNLLKLCEQKAIIITKIVNVKNFFHLFCLNHSEAEKLFNDEISISISNCGGEVILPSELRASRSVLLHRVDKLILENTTDQIKSEILKCNPIFKFCEVVKIGRSDKLKIEFSSSSEAAKCCSSGLSMFYLHIPISNIEQDKFYKIETCFHCYAVEKHLTSDCPIKLENPNFIVCSKCASHSHDFKSCTAQVHDFKCINCNENHNAMAMKCPFRKEALKQKRRGATLSFASQTKRSLSIQDSPDNSMIAKSFSLTVLALLKCTDAPEKFSDEINGLFVQNGLPKLNLTGFVPPSISSLQKLFTSQQITNSASELQTNLKEKTDECSFASTTDETNAQPISSKSSGTRNLRSSNSTSQRTREPSIGSLDSQLQPRVWNGYRVLKQHGSTVVSSQDLRSSWEAGNLLICTENGNVPDYNTVSKMIDSGVLPYMQTIVKKNEFKAIRNSPKRFLNRIRDSE